MFLKQSLITKAKQGDNSAVESLYLNHISGLFIFVRTKVNTDEQTEDICSEAFLKAISNLESFKEKCSFKSWLYTIAHNLILDFYKKNSKEVKIKDFDPVQIEEDDEENTGNERNEEFEVCKEIINSSNIYPSSYSLQDKDVELLKKILGMLPDNYRQVLELRFLSNCNIKETAEIMKLSQNNIKVLQNRAFKKAKLLVTTNNF